MGERERIFIIDDYADIRNLLGIIFRIEGHRVVAAVGSVEEVRTAEPFENPTLALVDVYLPDGTGEDAAQALRERYGNEIKIIAHTAEPEGINWADGIAVKGEQDELCRIIKEA